MKIVVRFYLAYVVALSIAPSASASDCQQVLGERFGPQSVLVVTPQSSIPEAGVESTLQALLAHNRTTEEHQVVLEQKMNPDGTWGSFQAAENKLALIDPELLKSIVGEIDLLRNQIEKSIGRRAEKIYFVIRVTSNQIGYAIRPGVPGTNNGFHIHNAELPGDALNLGFVWALRGPGVVYQIGEELYYTPQGKIAALGHAVFHGSPDTENVRLVIVGGIHL